MVNSRAARRRSLRRPLVRATVAAGAVAAAGAAGTWAAHRSAMRRWSSAPDHCGPDLRALPLGEPISFVTDDGAAITGVHLRPEQPGATAGAPLVVLSHCWTGNRFVWAPVARRLVDAGCEVVLYDHRGHGESAIGTDPITLPRLADDLGQLLEHVDARDIVLAGHSMGGMAVQQLAVRHPQLVDERVRSIVLVATAPRSPFVPPFDRSFHAVARNRRAAQLMSSGLGPAMVRGVFGRSPHLTHINEALGTYLETDLAVRVGCVEAIGALDLRSELPAVAVPTTVMVGRLDTLLPARFGREIAALVPDAELIELRDAGHMLPFEAPDEVASVLEAHARDRRDRRDGNEGPGVVDLRDHAATLPGDTRSSA